MKFHRLRFAFSALAAVSALIFSACSPEEKTDPAKEKFSAYAQRVPERATVFVGGYCPTDYQKKILADAGWKKFVNALRGNAALSAKAKALLADAEKDAPEIPLRKLVGDDPVAALAAFCEASEAPAAAVFFIDEPIDFSARAGAPAWTLAATVAPDAANFLAALLDVAVESGNAQGDERLTKEVSADGARAFFTLRERGNVVACVAIRGAEIVAASSRERVEAFEKSLAVPAPARGVFDAPVFAKLAKGAPENSQIFAYLNFDGIKDFRDCGAGCDSLEKDLRGNAQGIAFFGDVYSSTTESECSLRAAFARPIVPHELIASMASRKFDALGGALPNAALAVGLGIPDLTPEIVRRLAPGGLSPTSDLARFARLDLRSICLSFADVEKVGNLLRRNFADVPLFFAKLECADVETAFGSPFLSKELDGNPMIGKRKIGEDEVFGMAMFGVCFGPLGKTSVYASNLPDAPAALSLAKGKGKSLADAGTFSAIAEKIRGNNAFEIYDDVRMLQKMQDELARAQRERFVGLAGTDAAETEPEFLRILTDCSDALLKKSLGGAALRADGDLLELRIASEYELDFGALADEIGKIR